MRKSAQVAMLSLSNRAVANFRRPVREAPVSASNEALYQLFATVAHGTPWYNPRTGEGGLTGTNKPRSWDGVIVTPQTFYRLVGRDLRPADMSAVPAGFMTTLTVVGEPMRMGGRDGVRARMGKGNTNVFILDD